MDPIVLSSASQILSHPECQSTFIFGNGIFIDTTIELVLNDIINDLEWVLNPKMMCVPTRRRKIM